MFYYFKRNLKYTYKFICKNIFLIFLFDAIYEDINNKMFTINKTV